jgi:hypothetical protein
MKKVKAKLLAIGALVGLCTISFSALESVHAAGKEI